MQSWVNNILAFLLVMLGWTSSLPIREINISYIIIIFIFAFFIRMKRRQKYLIFSIALVILSLISIAYYSNDSLPNTIHELSANQIIDKNINESNISLLNLADELINNIKSKSNENPHIAFSMLIEVNRKLNNGIKESKYVYDFINKYIINTFLPSAPKYSAQIYSNTITLIFITISFIFFYSITKENSYIEIYKIFYLLSSSAFLLAIAGIYFKFNYIRGNVVDGKEILGLLPAPEPRISFSSFTYKNHWSAYSILIICVCFEICRIILKNKTRILFRSKLIQFLFVVILILILSIFYSNSTSGVIIASFAIISCTVYLFSVYKLWKKFKLRITIACISIFIIVFNVEFVQNRIESLFHGNSFRIGLYADIIQSIKLKTFWGNGINSYKTFNGIFQSQFISDARSANLSNAHSFYIPVTVHAHSDFLQIINEFGFMGAVLLIFPLFFLTLHRILNLKHFEFPYITIGILCLLLYGLIDFPFRNLAVISLFFMLLPLMFRTSNRFTRSRNKTISTCRT